MIFKYPILQDTKLIDFLNSFHLSKDKINNLVNGKISIKQNIITDKDCFLKKGQEISIVTDEYDFENYEPAYFELDILYEDDYLLIINKPSNTIIYDLDGGIGLDNYVQCYYQMRGYTLSVRHLQRLDKDTTGCIIYCKDILSHAKLSFDLENNLISKNYLALTEGCIKKDFVVNKPLGTNRHINGQMVISKTGKEAITKFKVLKYTHARTLLLCTLITGRRHQIRVHLQSEKHSIIGDSLYNENYNNEELCLDCHFVEFIHPITKINVSVSTPILDKFKI